MMDGLVVKQGFSKKSRNIQFLVAFMATVALLALATLPDAGAAGCIARGGSTALYLSSSWPNQNVPRQVNGYPVPIQGTHKVLFILIENAAGGAKFNAALRDPKIWAGRIAEMDKYYNEVSCGRMRIVPATEISGTANDGVIGPITAPSLSFTTSTAAITPYLAYEAITGAWPYVNYASFDTNKDAMLSSDELNIFIVQAGYEETYDPRTTPYPSTWMQSRSWDEPTYVQYYGYQPSPYTGYYFRYAGLFYPIPRYLTNDVAISSYNYVGSQIYTGPGSATATPVGPFVHLMGHDIGLPDFDNLAAGAGDFLGYHSLMSMGQWCGNGATPSHPDALLKYNLGWEVLQSVVAPLNASFMLSATEGTNQAVYIQTPNSPKGGNEGFLIENRQHIGYDAGLPGTQGGLAIYHLDLGTGTVLINPTIRMVQAKSAVFTSLGLGYFGSETDYFRAGNNITLNDLTTPNSNLFSGALSDIAIDRISASGPIMTFDTNLTARVGFTYDLQYLSEAAGTVNLMVKLDRKMANPVKVDYNYLAGSATPGPLPAGSFTFAETNYQATGPYTLTFAPGETSKYFTVNINNDGVVTNNKNATFILSNPYGAILDTTHTTLRTTFIDNDNPYLNITSPNGGEIINKGSNIIVTWLTNTAVAGNLVRADLYANGTFYQTLNGALPNTGASMSAIVNIPANIPYSYKYRLVLTSVTNPTYTDQSDGDFSIIDPNFKIVSYVINDGKTSITTTRDVLLNITVPAGMRAPQYMASESSVFAGELWKSMPVNPVNNVYSIPFTLSKGTSNKWVYVKLRSSTGQATVRASNWIRLIVVPVAPVVQPIASTSTGEHVVYTAPTPVLTAGDLPVMWSLVAGPAGATINTATGVVTWRDPKIASSPATFRVRATNNVGFGEAIWTVTVVTADIGNAVDSPWLSWRQSGAGWFYQTAVAADRVDAARSGVVTSGGKATASVTVTGPGTLTFWWKVSSQANVGKLGFYIGGKLQKEITGEVGWQYLTFAVPAGTTSLDWTYSKSGTTVGGMDAGFLDYVAWTPATK